MYKESALIKNSGNYAKPLIWGGEQKEKVGVSGSCDSNGSNKCR
jgi:hypothetical protein